MVPGVASPAAALPLVISTGRSAFPLSFRAEHEVRSREICFEPGSGASISFQAATGGAPFGCASLRPLPESTASSLRDNLYLQGPTPCPLRGWICPPCGSLKALHRSAAPSCNSPYTAENAKASNIKVLTFSGVAGEHK